MALAGTFAPFFNQNIPSSPFPDSVTGFIDPQGNPLFPEYSGSQSVAPVPGGPGTTPPGGGNGGGFDFIRFWINLMKSMINGLADKMKFSFVNMVNEKSFMKITSDLILKDMERF